MILKWIPRVGPCRSSIILGESLYDGHLRKRTPSTGPYLVLFRVKLTDRRIIYSERNAVTIQA